MISTINFACRSNKGWRYRSWTRIPERCNLFTHNYDWKSSLSLQMSCASGRSRSRSCSLTLFFASFIPLPSFLLSRITTMAQKARHVSMGHRDWLPFTGLSPSFISSSETDVETETGLWMDLYVYLLSLIFLRSTIFLCRYRVRSLSIHKRQFPWHPVVLFRWRSVSAWQTCIMYYAFKHLL